MHLRICIGWKYKYSTWELFKETQSGNGNKQNCILNIKTTRRVAWMIAIISVQLAIAKVNMVVHASKSCKCKSKCQKNITNINTCVYIQFLLTWVALIVSRTICLIVNEITCTIKRFHALEKHYKSQIIFYK